MKRQSPYGDANMMNPYSSSQMQHVSLHRVQDNPIHNSYSGQMGSFMHEDDRLYSSSANADAQWWDRDTQQMSPHLRREGQSQRNNANSSIYQNKMSDQNQGLNQETRVPLQERDMELGREDNPSSQTFEGLEKKFSDDIMKLVKKHMDSEDAENARHREKIMEINNQYQEKLVALRARYATRREELFRKESQTRLQRYQLTMRQYQNDLSGPADTGHRGGGYSIGSAGVGPFPSESQAQRAFSGRGLLNSHRQRRPSSESYGRGRMQGTDSRATPSSGRGYNTGPRYY